MSGYPMTIGAEYLLHSGETVRVTGFWPCGRGHSVTFRRVQPYDNGYVLRCAWGQFKRDIKSALAATEVPRG